MSKPVEKPEKAKRKKAIVFSPSEGVTFTNGSNGNHIERPYRINPETLEQREKRLAKRKALTLKVFKWAYENNNAKAG